MNEKTDAKTIYRSPYRPKFRDLCSPIATAIRDDYSRHASKDLDKLLDKLSALIESGEFDKSNRRNTGLKELYREIRETDDLNHEKAAKYIGWLTKETGVDILGVVFELVGQMDESRSNQYLTPLAVADMVPNIANICRESFSVDRDECNQAGQVSLGSFGKATEDDDTRFPEPSLPTSESTTVIFEPSCGSGRMLLSAGRGAKDDREAPVAIGFELSEQLARASALSLALADIPGWICAGNALTLSPRTLFKIPSGDGVSVDTYSVPTNVTLELPDWKESSETLNIDVDSAIATAGGAKHEINVVQEILDSGVDMTIGNPPFDTVERESDYRTPDATKMELYEVFHREQSVEQPCVSSQQSEWVFCELAMRCTSPAGAVSMVLPESILANPSEKDVRKWLLEKRGYIESSISLPRSTFEPATGTKTGVLTIKPRVATETSLDPDYEVFMCHIDTVGVDSQNQEITATKDGEVMKLPIGQLPKFYRTRGEILGIEKATIPDNGLYSAITEHSRHRQNEKVETKSQSEEATGMAD